MARYANQRRRYHSFEIRDKELRLRRTIRSTEKIYIRKLHANYDSQFTLLKQVSPVSFRIELYQQMQAKGIQGMSHKSLLKLHKEDKHGREMLTAYN